MGKKEFRNFGDLTDLNKNLDEICRMCWFDDEENKVSMRCSEILTEFNTNSAIVLFCYGTHISVGTGEKLEYPKKPSQGARENERAAKITPSMHTPVLVLMVSR